MINIFREKFWGLRPESALGGTTSVIIENKKFRTQLSDKRAMPHSNSNIPSSIYYASSGF